MTDWYEQAFGRNYLALYPHRNDAEARSDVASIIELIAPPTAEPLLDLCCGAGRHLLALHEAGFTDLTGIDLSQTLLDVARPRLDGAGANQVRLIRSDMREIPFFDHFATVLSLFTSFGYFGKPAEDEAVLHSVYAALRPGGAFLIDTLNRERIIDDLTPFSEEMIGSARVRIDRRISSDRLRVEKTIRVQSEDGSPKIYRESVRMYSAEEMWTLLEQASFTKVRFHGALDGRPHSPTSPRMVVAACKPTRKPA